jgi:tRNA dimethylallyltransferase
MYDWLARTKSEFKDSDFLKLQIDTKREKLIERINIRTSSMINNGAINEVKKFLKLKIRKDQSVNKVIGIAELTQCLNKKITLDQAKELISIKTRQYAKRQATWARTRMISWVKIDPSKTDSYIKKLKKSFLKLDQ